MFGMFEHSPLSVFFFGAKPVVTTLGCNFILIFYGLFQVYKYIKEKDRTFLTRSFIAFGSPIICSLCIFLVDRVWWTDLISDDVLMIPAICTAFSLAMLAFNQPVRFNKLPTLTTQAKIGIVAGLSVFGIFLLIATIAFNVDDHSNIQWQFILYPSLYSVGLHPKVWAYSFFMLFTRFFYVGLLSPFLWILNGLAWTTGKKLFALLLTLHLVMVYIELPWLLAIIFLDAIG